MMRVYRLWVALVAALVLLSNQALAHGIELQVKVINPGVIQGVLSYSDGSVAQDQYIQIDNLTDGSFSAIALKTGVGGDFLVAGVPGHRYRIIAEGDEGHRVSQEVELQPSASTESGLQWPPLYLMIVALVLLSLILAYFLRKK